MMIWMAPPGGRSPTMNRLRHRPPRRTLRAPSIVNAIATRAKAISSVHQDACAANRGSFDKPDDRHRSAMVAHLSIAAGGLVSLSEGQEECRLQPRTHRDFVRSMMRDA